MLYPKVSIIIPTQSLRSKTYLDICMKSIEGLRYPKEQLEVIISSPLDYHPEFEGVKVVHHDDPKRSFAQAVNHGVASSDPLSKHILLLSDDTIMTPDSLANLVDTLSDSEVIMNATSNCDNYWQYVLRFQVEYEGLGVDMTERFMRLETVNHLVPAMLKAQSLYPSGALKVESLCFYATLIPRVVWAKLGALDERFRDGFEDSDYCERARKEKVGLFIALNALIWHFGGVTTDSIPQVEKDKNETAFFEKWIGAN